MSKTGIVILKRKSSFGFYISDLEVDRNKVLRALTFLKSNHKAYKSDKVRISRDNLNEIPIEGHIPENCLTVINQTDIPQKKENCTSHP